MFLDDEEKDKINIKMGLKYDDELKKKYPDITERLKENRKGGDAYKNADKLGYLP